MDPKLEEAWRLIPVQALGSDHTLLRVVRVEKLRKRNREKKSNKVQYLALSSKGPRGARVTKVEQTTAGQYSKKKAWKLRDLQKLAAVSDGGDFDITLDREYYTWRAPSRADRDAFLVDVAEAYRAHLRHPFPPQRAVVEAMLELILGGAASGGAGGAGGDAGGKASGSGTARENAVDGLDTAPDGADVGGGRGAVGLSDAEVADLESVLSHHDVARLDSKSLSDMLGVQLSALEAENVSTILGSDGGVQQLVLALDDAAESLAMMLDWINEHAVQLGEVRGHLSRIERQNNAMETQTQNHKELLTELSALLGKLDFDRDDTRVLVEGSLDGGAAGLASMIRAGRRLLDSMRALAKLDPIAQNMVAVRERFAENARLRTLFSKNLAEHLQGLLSQIFGLDAADDDGGGGGSGSGSGAASSSSSSAAASSSSHHHRRHGAGAPPPGLKAAPPLSGLGLGSGSGLGGGGGSGRSLVLTSPRESVHERLGPLAPLMTLEFELDEPQFKKLRSTYVSAARKHYARESRDFFLDLRPYVQKDSSAKESRLLGQKSSAVGSTGKLIEPPPRTANEQIAQNFDMFNNAPVGKWPPFKAFAYVLKSVIPLVEAEQRFFMDFFAIPLPGKGQSAATAASSATTAAATGGGGGGGDSTTATATVSAAAGAGDAGFGGRDSVSTEVPPGRGDGEALSGAGAGGAVPGLDGAGTGIGGLSRAASVLDDPAMRRHAETLWENMNTLFEVTRSETISLAEWLHKLDPLTSLRVIVESQRRMAENPDHFMFVTELLTNLQGRLKGHFAEWIERHLESIRGYKLEDRRPGIVPCFAKFPLFVDQMESAVTGERVFVISAFLESVYQKIVLCMFDWLEGDGTAQSPKYRHLIRFENYHHFFRSLEARPHVLSLREELSLARERHAEAFRDYLDYVVRYQLESLFSFFDGITRMLDAGTDPSEVQFQESHNRQQLHALIRGNPKNVRKGLEGTFRRLERHLSPDERPLSAVWRDASEFILAEYAVCCSVTERCYPQEKGGLKPTLGEVEVLLDEFNARILDG